MRSGQDHKALRLLLVEDEPLDALIFQRVLSHVDFPHTLEVVTHGEAALSHLRSGAPLPDLMLLDLNMPRMTGQEVLDHLRTDDALSALKVVVFSSARMVDEADACLEAGAVAYFEKPFSFDEYGEFTRVLRAYCLEGEPLPTYIHAQAHS